MTKKIASIFLLILCSMFIVSCSKVDSLKVKVGIKNDDFEYIKQGKIKKIVIQSTRDKGFRFVVTDKNAIYELYDILSSGKKVETQSSLKPDYVFEMHEKGGKILEFNYIAGLDRKEKGNFYNGDSKYIVSSRVDNDIIKNFWNIRKPREFTTVYYNSILAAIDKYNQHNDENSNMIIDIKDDLDVARFVLSTDLERFKGKIETSYDNITLYEDVEQKYDVLIKVNTEGYKSTVYKSKITFARNINNEIDKNYFIWAKYNSVDKLWNIEVFEDKEPEGF